MELRPIFIQLWLLILSLQNTQGFSVWTKWSDWSSCSKTCGEGMRSRERICLRMGTDRCVGSRLEFGRCYEKLCTSYLDWPRIHFSGHFDVDTPTTNNYRCFFNNQHFCPYCNTIRNPYSTHIKESNHTMYKYKAVSNAPNPMGNGHFYFYETKVKSACWDKASHCTVKDPIVTRAVQGVSPGRMVDLDVDWQLSPEVVGFSIHIPGVFTARMLPGVSSQLTNRVASGGSAAGDMNSLSVVKSKLDKVEWIDPYFKRKFKNATSLSISFILDIFSYSCTCGRLSGTIGMTSMDDPVNSFGARVMRPITPSEHSEAPINLDIDSKMLLVDLSSSIKSDAVGLFRKGNLRNVDIVFFPDVAKELCQTRGFDCCVRSVTCSGRKGFLLTLGGALNFVQRSESWYSDYGGVVQISLKWADVSILNLLARSRIGFVDRTAVGDNEVAQSSPTVYSKCGLFPELCYCETATNPGKCKVISVEAGFGVNFKPLGRFTERKAFGESWKLPVQVSSFGRPLKGAKLEIRNIKKSKTVVECNTEKNPCSMYVSTPHNVLDFGKPALSDINGISKVKIDVVRNPGFPRKCGLDGQIYLLGLFFDYSSPAGVEIKLAEGGMFYSAGGRGEKQCHIQGAYSALGTTLKVYGSLPASTMQQTCPTWMDDILPIFQFYANTVPVMSKEHIIDLRNANDVRSKLRMINMSMFEYDWDHPNFMPTTRDLSPDKTEVVRRWLECEMNGIAHETPPPKSRLETLRKNVCGSQLNLQKTIDDLHRHIQTAMWVELYTIPPYMTAMFSIKENHFKEIYSLLKRYMLFTMSEQWNNVRSISIEEMLHVSLNGNILNAIGGKPNMTDSYWLPNYPTPFPSADFYQINPGGTLKLEKFSISLLEDFAQIEKPAPPEVLKTIYKIALLWRRLPADKGGRWKRLSEGDIELYEDSATGDTSHGPKWLEAAIRNNFDDKVNHANNQPQINFWEEIFETASNLLEKPYIADVYSIGGFYAHLMLKLIQTEACVLLEYSDLSIFVGDPERQLGLNQWYVTKGISSATLFPVKGLKSAVEAMMEIVYEGEGGTPCAPYITSLPGLKEAGKVENPYVYSTITSPYSEKSHHVKFQEMIHGRTLIPVAEIQPSWSEDACLETYDFCPCIASNETTVQPMCMQFCYKGKSLVLKERDVWPVHHAYSASIAEEPSPKMINAQYTRTSGHFNSIYTRLLKCLESTMNGNPQMMSSCIGNMYELVTIGKKLARTPLLKGSNSQTGPNATPRWLYVRDPYKQEGLDDLTAVNEEVYC